MIAMIRRHFGDDARLDRLTAAFAASGCLQGVAFVLLIWFLRAYLGDSPQAAIPWFIWFALAALGSAAVYIAAMAWGARVSVYGACDSMIRAIGERLIRLPLGWFDARAKARVVKVLKQDTNTVAHGPSVVLPVIATNLATLATIAVATLAIDWRLGIALVITAPAYWVLYRWQERLLDAPTNEHETAVENLGGRVIEFVQAQPVLRATGNTDHVWPALQDEIESETTLNLGLQRAQSRPSSWFMLTSMATMLIALISGALLVMNGSLDAITFIALMLIVTRFIEPLSLLIHYGAEVSHVKKAVANAASILDDPLLPEPTTPARPDGDGCSLDAVGFGYDTREVLHDVSLTATPHAVTALVGPSGSGKSTVLRLLARFWDPANGSVRHGTVDVRELGTSSVMARTAMVFQSVYLFDTTIRENVLIAQPEATDEQLAAAAHTAALDEVIARLPDGWETRVGEGGARLSGGERQRVSLARAFLRDTPIVLLDEATSSLDGLSEQRVTEAIATLGQTRTVVVIAHRLSTVQGADTIVTVADGRIAETGTHDELLANPQSIYASFWRDQQRASSWQLRGAD